MEVICSVIFGLLISKFPVFFLEDPVSFVFCFSLNVSAVLSSSLDCCLCSFPRRRTARQEWRKKQQNATLFFTRGPPHDKSSETSPRSDAQSDTSRRPEMARKRRKKQPKVTSEGHRQGPTSDSRVAERQKKHTYTTCLRFLVRGARMRAHRDTYTTCLRFFLCGALACERTAQKKTNQNTQTAGTVSPEATPTLRESNPKSDRAVTHTPCRFIVTCRRGTDPWFTDPRSTGNVCVRVRVVCFGCGALTCERHANKKTFTDQGSADQGPVNRLI